MGGSEEVGVVLHNGFDNSQNPVGKIASELMYYLEIIIKSGGKPQLGNLSLAYKVNPPKDNGVAWTRFHCIIGDQVGQQAKRSWHVTGSFAVFGDRVCEALGGGFKLTAITDPRQSEELWGRTRSSMETPHILIESGREVIGGERANNLMKYLEERPS